MSFNRVVRRMDAAIFGAFSEVALYNDTQKVSVIIDEGVERENGYGEQIINAFEVVLHRQEVANPKKGDRVTLSPDMTLILDSFVKSDRAITIMSATLDQSR